MLKNMKKTGESLTKADLSNIEKQIEYSLPIAYKEFLLKYNGGIPDESYIDFNAQKINISSDEIKRFYGFGGKTTNDLVHKLNSIGDNLPKGMIFIANTHGGNFFLLSLRQDSYGEVFYKDHEYEDKTAFNPEDNLYPESIVKVANSFDEFLSRLYEFDE